MKTKTLLLAATSALTLAGAAQAESLSIYAWSGELPQEIVDDFAAETGIDVTMDTFDSNETMMARISVGASGYDLIEPTQYAVQVLSKQGRLMELDKSKLPNIVNLAPAFADVTYDPGLTYSVPYVWGTTGIGYNTECFDEAPTSWKTLFDPELAGRIYMLDNMLGAFIVGLQVNGFSASTDVEEEIATATQTLIDQKPLLGGYNSTNFADLLATGEACAVEGWNGSIAGAITANDNVGYVIPEEGGTMWIDGFAIPANAENPDAAHMFIDYMMRPDVAAKAAALSSAATTIEAAMDLLPEEVANNAAIYPPQDALMNVDFILDVGDAMRFYQDGWTAVKLAQ